MLSFLGAFNEEFLSVCRCENCVVRSGLARLVLVGDGALFSHGRGELRLGHFLGHPRLLHNRPGFVGHSVVPEGLVVLVQLLHVQRLVRTLLVLTLLSVLTLNFFGVRMSFPCVCSTCLPRTYTSRCFSGSFSLQRKSRPHPHL